jgi:hypothetical protein
MQEVQDISRPVDVLKCILQRLVTFGIGVYRQNYIAT